MKKLIFFLAISIALNIALAILLLHVNNSRDLAQHYLSQVDTDIQSEYSDGCRTFWIKSTISDEKGRQIAHGPNGYIKLRMSEFALWKVEVNLYDKGDSWGVIGPECFAAGDYIPPESDASKQKMLGLNNVTEQENSGRPD